MEAVIIILGLFVVLFALIIFIIFSVTDGLGGNGYLAVYIAGIVVGNKPLVKKKEISTFLDGMNRMTEELGCDYTHFANLTGLDSLSQYTTARDMYRIVRYCQQQPLFYGT